MQTKYTKKFKIEAVKRVLLRDSETTAIAVARSLGVKNSTLHGWVKSMKNKDLKEETNNTPSRGGCFEKKPYNWTIKERFEIIVESSKIPKEDLSEYCRKKGLFPHHLEKWKSEFIDSFGENRSKVIHDKKKLKNEIKTLSIELRRKEKALAEAAALLMLKKKANDLWPEREDF